MSPAPALARATELEVVLARERAMPGEGAVEALVRVEVRVLTDERRHVWRAGGAPSLGSALDAWPREPFPQFLDALTGEFEGLRPRVALTADHFSWLARRAPRTFERLVRETDLVQRDPCYALVCDAQGVRFVWRPAGPVAVESRPAPLFDLAHALSHGRVPGASAADAEASELVRAALLAHWVRGRLPAELEWLGATRSLRRRGDGRALFLREGRDHGSRELVLVGDGLPEPLALDCTPPPGTPAVVVRAALEWLLTGPARDDDELFLDPAAQHVRSRIQ